jgi:hypothetical protein
VLSLQNLSKDDLFLGFKSDNEDYENFLHMIRAKIETNKTDVLNRLENVELDDRRLNEFFEMARDASTGIIPRLNNH